MRAVRRACALPVWAKLPADTPAATSVLAALASAGAAATSFSGGLPVGGPDGTGGYLVGPATFPVVLALVQQLAAESPLPIIAGGGVVSPVEARAYLRAGAAAVQVGLDRSCRRVR